MFASHTGGCAALLSIVLYLKATVIDPRFASVLGSANPGGVAIAVPILRLAR
jgi:hypothetical protein